MHQFLNFYRLTDVQFDFIVEQNQMPIYMKNIHVNSYLDFFADLIHQFEVNVFLDDDDDEAEFRYDVPRYLQGSKYVTLTQAETIFVQKVLYEQSIQFESMRRIETLFRRFDEGITFDMIQFGNFGMFDRDDRIENTFLIVDSLLEVSRYA